MTLNPDPGIWNYYFGSKSNQYDSIQNKNDLFKIYRGKNIYISNCNFNNLHDRAIYIFDLACPNVLTSFCSFKDCSTQSEEGGGAFFAHISNVIIYFTCAIHPHTPYEGLFARFLSSDSYFTPQFETSTVYSCDSQESGQKAVDFNNCDLKVSSSNFTDIKASRTSVLYYVDRQDDSDKTSSLNFCSFVKNTASRDEIVFLDGPWTAFVQRCNFISNEVTESGSYRILNLYGDINQIIESCFYENNANLDISFGFWTNYVINCSFSKGLTGISGSSSVNTDEAGTMTFSLNLAHLSSNECKAPIQKTPMKFEANNNNNLKVNVYCSCGMYFPFMRIDSNFIPMFFIPSS